MTEPNPIGAMTPEEALPERRILGLRRKQRFRVYRSGAVLLVAGFIVWAWCYLQPHRWYTYTDQIAFEQVARDVNPGHVIWEPAVPEGGGMEEQEITQPAISSDGVRLVYSAGKSAGNANLFLRRWDGTNWGAPRPMRALNSNFHETAPAMSGDGAFLYFTSDRPGGRGGQDIWVARWDGAEYAWPLPLTGRVNTVHDEVDPALSADGLILYFASNRPPGSADRSPPGNAGTPASNGEARVEASTPNFDLYAADVAGETPFELLIERRLNMLYSLREGALGDPEVMIKLGGSNRTESAVDRGLAYLADIQEPDGRWNISKSGGQGGHDVAATAFSLLAFYGRGERHDQDCKYRDTVTRGLNWLLTQQDGASGDLRGPRPGHNAMYDHGAAALALVEAYGVTKDPTLRPRAHAAIEFITESQHPQGGWRYKPGEKGDLSVTGWMIMTLGSARMSGIPVPPKTSEGVANFLQHVRGGPHGGSYGYTDSPGKRNSGRNGMNAAGFFCAQLTGSSFNGAQAYESSAIINKAGFHNNDLYYAYYGTLAAYQHQGPGWRDWKEQMHPLFLETQSPDGSWTARGKHGAAMGRVVGTALVVLCLEAHYRYTPLYGLGFEPDPAGPTPDVLDQTELPVTPLYRHAKRLAGLSSPADDTGPVVTEHGDFLYFSSGRSGGLGGADLYRARISGPAPGESTNLGPEVNSTADETNPAIRMAGFHLLFNSDRGDKTGALYSAKSGRVVRRYDYTNLPTARWLLEHLPWLLGLVTAAGGFAWFTRRALAARGADDQPNEHVCVNPRT